MSFSVCTLELTTVHEPMSPEVAVWLKKEDERGREIQKEIDAAVADAAESGKTPRKGFTWQTQITLSKPPSLLDVCH